ncbi:isopentenyl-diphosphate Delta-isomerase [Microbacterium dextranolyticum]|uniref:Isopentenyl-diphosphate Delta-isomerase n=1 Tax=Microbacterium dextranolyticum TaxID=36806 RepID=A0A9W6HNA1_9MICO|nr:isopentenyl-diphosphate Delta-isomerase [Microbacterium dextranolyticum]MBM7463256.1 isopentenyl-diphosphate delta-isomerase [Microbacterium dextranolyticum]GLJ95638.1 isopentenyl-diphosphate Delta-isomerase [Microbacterium dextranolyticum]
MPPTDTAADLVVLVDDEGNPIGSAPKAEVHGSDTPLHLAFSCHVYDAHGRTLLTRRALDKRTWPGVWTNSFCGHPRPGEAVVDAVHRHAAHELGLILRDVRIVLPSFRYRAVDASGVVENEVCPVYTAVVDDEPTPNRREVVEAVWESPAALAASVRATPWAFSPWLVLQMAQLDGLSPNPAASVR